MQKRDNVVNLSDFRKAKEAKEHVHEDEDSPKELLSLDDAVAEARGILNELSDRRKLIPDFEKYNHGPEKRTLDEEIADHTRTVTHFSTDDLVRLMSKHKDNPNHFHKPYLYVLAERLVERFDTPRSA